MSKACYQGDDVTVHAFGHFRPTGAKAFWLALCRAMPTRRLALWMRKPIKNSFGHWVDVEVWGLRLRIAPKGNLTEQRLLFMPDHYDCVEREVVSTQLLNGGVFLDVGANIGAYSLWAASLRRDGVSVEAFEPDPQLCDRLEHNLDENGIKNVALNRIALGREVGVLTLSRDESNFGQNQISDSGEGLQVPVKTLLSVLEAKGVEKVAVLKIDVEGYECEVLEPFFAEAPREMWPARVICEDLDDGEQAAGAKLLEASGYKLDRRTRMNGIFSLSATP